MLTISKNSKSYPWILLLSSIPVLLFFYTFFQYASNIPFQDDYDALLEPVTRLKNLPSFSWKELFTTIWTQDDERRIIVDRIAAVLIYKINGSLDLRIQMFAGLLSLVGIFFLLYKVIQEAQLPALLLVASAFLLFHIQYYEAIFWGMIPLQHITIYFFALAAFYHLHAPTPIRLTLAVVAGMLAIGSDVSGTFVLPAGLVILVLQRQWKYAVLWTLGIGIVILLYYYRLEVPAYRPKLSDNFAHPKLIVYNFFAFSGLSADFNTLISYTNRVTFILFAGMLLWGSVFTLFFLLVRKTFFTHDIRIMPRWQVTLWGGIIHLGIVILAFAVGRAMDGPDAVLISRYKHIGFIWLILVSVAAISQLQANYLPLVSKIWFGISICLFGFSYFEYLAPLDYYYKERNTDMYGWEHNRALPSSPIYLSLTSAVDTITEESIAAGIYTPPRPYFFDTPYQVSSTRFPLKVNGQEVSVTFDNDTFVRGTHKNDGAYVVLKSTTQNHIIPSKQKRFSLKSYLFSGGSHYYANGFTSTFPKAYLRPNATYDVLVITIANHRKYIHTTGYQVSNINSEIRVIEV